MKKGDIIGLLCLITMLGGLACLFLFAPSRAEVVFAPLESPGSALVVREVRDDGVRVDAVLAVPGFVTLHGTIGDAPGPILGTSSFLPEGISTDFFVPAMQMIVPGDAYVLLMAADDGDGVYEAGVDRPVMVDGKVIRVPISFVSETQ